MQEVAQALQYFEATLIPAVDGGYVLLGMTRLDSSVFTGIAWSTYSVKMLPTLHDVDVLSDLQWLPQALVRAPA